MGLILDCVETRTLKTTLETLKKEPKEDFLDTSH